jgi:hypothetical protein
MRVALGLGPVIMFPRWKTRVDRWNPGWWPAAGRMSRQVAEVAVKNGGQTPALQGPRPGGGLGRAAPYLYAAILPIGSSRRPNDDTFHAGASCPGGCSVDTRIPAAFRALNCKSLAGQLYAPTPNRTTA